MKNNKSDEDRSRLKQATKSPPKGGAGFEESLKSENILNVHDSKIKLKAANVDVSQSKKIEENDKSEIKDTFGIGAKIDAELIPSPETATKSAINDSPSNKDSIGFTPYVQALSRMVIHPKTMTPLTIGIMGPWGTGKTSFMKQIKEAIINLDEKIKHVEFNAWKYDVQETLWTAFLQTIVLQIDRDLGWIQRWRIRLRSIWKKTNKIALIWNLAVTGALVYIASYYLNKFQIKLEWSLIVLIPFGALGFLINPLTQIWKKVKVPLGIDIADMFSSNQVSENISNFIEFEADLKKILDIYVGENGRLVTYIDDLDRCSPHKVVDVLETINVFIDTDRCIFLLGMDHPKVVLAINVKFKEHIEMLQKNRNGNKKDNGFGEGFLEKIVQIPIYVPKLGNEHIGEFLNEYFDHKAAESRKGPNGDDEELPSLKDVAIDQNVEIILKHTIECIDKNPRSIKKYLNVFRYVYLLYIANRNAFKDVKEYALPLWFVIAYENKKSMATIEEDHSKSTWDDIKNGFDGKYPNIGSIYKKLTENKEASSLLGQLNGPIKDYFPLTRLLYD